VSGMLTGHMGAPPPPPPPPGAVTSGLGRGEAGRGAVGAVGPAHCRGGRLGGALLDGAAPAGHRAPALASPRPRNPPQPYAGQRDALHRPPRSPGPPEGPAPLWVGPPGSCNNGASADRRGSPGNKVGKLYPAPRCSRRRLGRRELQLERVGSSSALCGIGGPLCNLHRPCASAGIGGDPQPGWVGPLREPRLEERGCGRGRRLAAEFPAGWSPWGSPLAGACPV
jgi:hypothetical protein